MTNYFSKLADDSIEEDQNMTNQQRIVMNWLNSDQAANPTWREYALNWLNRLQREGESHRRVINRLRKENEQLRNDCEVLKNRCTGVYE